MAGLVRIGDAAASRMSVPPSAYPQSPVCCHRWTLDCPLLCEPRGGIPGRVLGKLTPGAIESDAFVLSQEKGEDIFKLLAGCWALGQRGDKPQG